MNRFIFGVMVKYLLVAGLLFGVLVGFYILLFSLFAKPQKSDVMLVLGAAAPNGVIPGSLLENRLQKALQLYKEDYCKFILVSGGKGPYERWPEAEVMRDYLVDKGVSPAVILIENQSTSTWTNFEYSLSILEQHRFKSILVTSSFSHLARANLVAKRFDLKNLSYSPSGRYSHLVRDFRSFLREIPAFMSYDFFYYRNGFLRNLLLGGKDEKFTNS